MSEGETHLQRVERALKRIRGFYESLEKESTRGAAVLAVARFEDGLCKAIEKKFKNPEPDILKYMPTLRKIELGYALGLYERTDRNNLIKRVLPIRNAFAHSAEPMDFDHEKVAAQCDKLNVTNPNPTDRRRRYLNYLLEVERRIARRQG